jgi:hypothetical protein
MVSIDAGMQTCPSDEQLKSAQTPRLEQWQSCSNSNSERVLHHLKQESGMISIDEGIQID